jgi:hypothetical protein
MPNLVLVLYALQLVCIVHIVRTRRSSSWIYLLIFLPIRGGIAYLAVELIPSLVGGRGRVGSASTLTDIVVRTVSPTARLRKYKREVDFSPTHENKRMLADEYLACGEHEKALGIYEALSVGTFSADAELMLARAKCLYALKRYPEGYALTASLDGRGFWYRKEVEVVLKLRLLEHVEGDIAKIAQRYSEYDKRFQSFEFGYYYAEFLARNHQTVEARKIIDRFAAVKKQLDAGAMNYDREWARRLLGMRLPREQTKQGESTTRSSQ